MLLAHRGRLASLPLGALLASLAAATDPSSPASEVRPLALLAHDGEGFAVALADGELGPGPVALPLLARSDRVARAVPGARGVGLRLEAVGGDAPLLAFELLAVPHPAEEEIVVVAGEPWLVGPPRLPLAARDGAGRDVLAELARQDLALATGRLVLEVQNGPSGPSEPGGPGGPGGFLLLVAGEGSAADVLVERRGAEGAPLAPVDGDAAGPTAMAIGSGGRTAGLVPLSGEETELVVELRAGSGLDQAVLVDARRLDLAPAQTLVPRAAALHPARAEPRTLRRGGRGAAVRTHGPEQALDPGRSDPAVVAWLAGEGPAPGEVLRRGASLEAWFPAPEPGEPGTTWTLLWTPRGEAPAVARAEEQRAAPASAARELLADVAEAAGVAMVHLEGPHEQLDIRPTMGPGAAWGDADGDGWVDLYVVQGGGRAPSAVPSSRLFRNLGGSGPGGRGRFADVTEASGAGHRGAGMGALFLDGDGDGDLDLYVASYGPDVLLENDGAGSFRDVSAAAGLSGERWSAGVAAADADLDGDLDLYVTAYLDYDPGAVPDPAELAGYRREDPVLMLPFAFRGQRNTFLRNEGPGPGGGMRFTDVTAELGLEDALGRGMQPLFWDFDRDGDQDLYVANDVSPNVLWRNEGDGTFRDVSFATGMDDPRGGMGVAAGDVEGDGDEDLFLTNWELEANALYANNLLSHRSPRSRVATFRDVIVPAGLGPFGIGATAWGAELQDLDLDGDLDLFVANGYTSPDYESTSICVGQPNHLFLNDGTGRFEDGRALAPDALDVALPSRAAVACDHDQDGDLDLLVTANNAPLQLLENRASRPGGGHWLVVRPRSHTANTHAIGAELELVLEGRSLRRTLRAGSSYLAGNPPEVHFGLGPAARVLELRVRWPDGSESSHALDGVDRFVTVHQPR